MAGHNKINAKIIIATHKKYRMAEDDLYLPLYVGCEGKESIGYVGDNTGDNISTKNPSFCELTGLYWAWKNLDADYVGLVHYRRYFALKKMKRDPFKNILSKEQLEELLKNYKVFLPQKRHYYIESLYSHYKHTHYVEQLDLTENIIEEIYPEYYSSYNRAVHKTSGYMFNMMILPRDLMDEYCSWLFDILFMLEKKTEKNDYSFYQGRFYGRISEIIFNVWLDYQISIGRILPTEIKELPYIYMEKINWYKKIKAFLVAKFSSKKYDSSF